MKITTQINNPIILAFIILSILLFNSCETTELELTNNPNLANLDQSDPDSFLNVIQIDFGKAVETFGALGAQVTRIDNMLGRNYIQAYGGSELNGLWNASYKASDVNYADQNGYDFRYKGILANIRALTPLAEEDDLFRHIAIGQVIEAYTIVSLVDFFGDIPYSEALQGSNNLNPNPDDGAQVYQAALDLLEDAILNFDKTPLRNPIDFYYDGDWTKWKKLANTLRMKILLQKRLVDANAITQFKAIVDSGEYITSNDEDFIFRWGNNVIQPDTRHPRFANNFEADGADEYMSNWLMNLMSTTDDPRIRYYYYRQANAVPGGGEIPGNEETLNCSVQTAPQHYLDGGFTFCYLAEGYWGRDHGDDAGTPPDGFLRTTFGVYPAGGRFDDSTFEGAVQTDGGQGAGITPILLASWVDFMRAEVAMLESDFGLASTLLEDGLRKSISKVLTFISLDPAANTEFIPDSDAINDFITNRKAAFDNALTEELRWNILSEQYWVTLFGNGIDAYNFYRRTGYPTTLQINIEPDPGNFIRSFFYPADAVNRNSALNQKVNVNQKVFWDINPNSPAFPAAN